MEVSRADQFHRSMNYYNNVSNILSNSCIFFNLSDKTLDRNRKPKLNSNCSKIVGKVRAKLDNASRGSMGSKSRSNSSDYKARSPISLRRGEERRALFLSLSVRSAERKLPFYSRGRPRMRRMALYRGPSTCRRRPRFRVSIRSCGGKKEYIPLSVLLSTFFSSGSFEWTRRRRRRIKGRGGGCTFDPFLLDLPATTLPPLTQPSMADDRRWF